jgi:hypothetical protein
MTQQLRAAGALSAATCALIVLGLPLMILLLLDPSSQAACGGSPTGPGPASVPGIPTNLLPIFEGAAQQFQLGNDGWAYLAALNNAESTFGTNNAPGTGVLSGSNSAGAAGPMQIGIGGAATDNWDTIVAEIPAGLPGGTRPPSVYNETDAVYAAAALLKKWGAPGNWQAALVAWNNYPPEIAQVTQLVAQYTNTAQQQSATTAIASTSTTTVPAGGFSGCVPVSGPSTPGAVAKVLPNGLAEIPQQAPPAVQEMIAAGNQIIGYPYSYGGGHSPSSMRVPPGPNADPGAQKNGGPGYDCSSSVSFVLWGGGLGQSLLGGQVDDSSTLIGVGQSGTGQWVTIYAGTSGRQGHTFIEVAGIVLDTVHGSSTTPAGTGPRWQPASEVANELASGSFVTRHPPGL